VSERQSYRLIPAPIFIRINSRGNPGKYWIPPYQVRGKLSQARNDKQANIHVVMYHHPICLIKEAMIRINLNTFYKIVHEIQVRLLRSQGIFKI
jgi:hypothetical protein